MLVVLFPRLIPVSTHLFPNMYGKTCLYEVAQFISHQSEWVMSYVLCYKALSASQYDGLCYFLQVNSDLKAAEATISVMSESKQTQMSSLSSLERKHESLKAQLQESQVNERLADQKLTSMREQLDDSRQRMVCP